MKINLGRPWRIGYASHFGGAVRVVCLGWLRIKIYSRQFSRDMKAKPGQRVSYASVEGGAALRRAQGVRVA